MPIAKEAPPVLGGGDLEEGRGRFVTTRQRRFLKTWLLLALDACRRQHIASGAEQLEDLPPRARPMRMRGPACLVRWRGLSLWADGHFNWRTACRVRRARLTWTTCTWPHQQIGPGAWGLQSARLTAPRNRQSTSTRSSSTSRQPSTSMRKWSNSLNCSRERSVIALTPHQRPDSRPPTIEYSMSGGAQSTTLKSPRSQSAQIGRTRSTFADIGYAARPTALRASSRVERTKHRQGFPSRNVQAWKN